jgi:glycerol-3-phosphate dehydrogenase
MDRRMSLDSRQRKETIVQLQSQNWDLLVIGGGITGAGIALDAAARGMKVALVEMQDYASGTSSRSTKLIHGGLRYLKQFELGLVREVGQERAILHENAGHIVVPEKMLLPIVQGGTFGKWGVRIGLWVYDRLAGVKASERRVMLSRDQATAAEPWLGKLGLQGAGLYSEYRTDDARLVIEVLKTAVQKGAVALNHARVNELSYYNGRLHGARVEDGATGSYFEISAKVVVNAAGPWVDGLREKDHSLEGKRLHHTKGVHLVVAHERLPLLHAVYFDVGDGRMIFAIPRGQWTYFGTTDTNYNGPLDRPDVTAADADYLIAAVNRMFPQARLEQSMVESSWAGIRPLIHEDGKSPSQLSRKDELFFSATGLITIAGGKLTGYRKMAEKVVNEVNQRLTKSGDWTPKPCTTDAIKLAGYQYAGAPPQGDDLQRLAQARGIALEEIIWLDGLYGSNVGEVLTLAGGTDRLSILRGALRYGIRAEGVARLGDFFVRRSAMLYFGRNWIAASLPAAREVFAEEFGAGYDPDPGMVFANAYADAVRFDA